MLHFSPFKQVYFFLMSSITMRYLAYGGKENLGFLGWASFGWGGLGFHSLLLVLFCAFKEHAVLGKQSRKAFLCLTHDSSVRWRQRGTWCWGADSPGNSCPIRKTTEHRPWSEGPCPGFTTLIYHIDSVWVRESQEVKCKCAKLPALNRPAALPLPTPTNRTAQPLRLRGQFASPCLLPISYRSCS